MKYIVSEHYKVYPGQAGKDGPVIYIIDMPEHPFGIDRILHGFRANIATVPVASWDDSLTPWPAPGLYRGDADFRGEATVTLSELVDHAVSAIERAEGLMPARRGICGYSLGGLFSLYAFTERDFFDALACLSGSVWYEGWIEHMRELGKNDRLSHLQGKFAFFSIGSKGKKANPKILHRVEGNMGECAKICRSAGCKTEFAIGPGSHVQFHEERFEAGLKALDANL